MTKTLGNTSKMINTINQLTNVQEIAQITTSLQTNLEKMGVVTDLVDDAMDQMDDVDIDEDVVNYLHNIIGSR